MLAVLSANQPANLGSLFLMENSVLPAFAGDVLAGDAKEFGSGLGTAARKVWERQGRLIPTLCLAVC